MGDDLCIGENLISPDMVRIFVGVDDVANGSRLDLADQLAELSGVTQIALGVDQQPTAGAR